MHYVFADWPIFAVSFRVGNASQSNAFQGRYFAISVKLLKSTEISMTSSLIHCIYASTPSPEFRESALPALLKNARRANLERGISGMLLYIDGSFFQVLEGSAHAVDAVYCAIKGDPRHRRVTLIIREPILERNFGDWTMGFANVAPDEVGQLLGENDFFTSGSCMVDIGAGRAKKLLMAFRSGRWRMERTGDHRAHARSA